MAAFAVHREGLQASRKRRGQIPDLPGDKMPFGSTASFNVSWKRRIAWSLNEYDVRDLVHERDVRAIFGPTVRRRHLDEALEDLRGSGGSARGRAKSASPNSSTSARGLYDHGKRRELIADGQGELGIQLAEYALGFEDRFARHRDDRREPQMPAALQQAEHAEARDAERDRERRIVLIHLGRKHVAAAVGERRAGDRAELFLARLPTVRRRASAVPRSAAPRSSTAGSDRGPCGRARRSKARRASRRTSRPARRGSSAAGSRAASCRAGCRSS